MPYVMIEKLFGSAWGLVEHRRSEIENGSFGVFDRVFREEINAQFPTAKQAAEVLRCSESTARRWLKDTDASYIFHDGLIRFAHADVLKVAEARQSQLKEREQKRKAKELGA